MPDYVAITQLTALPSRLRLTRHERHEIAEDEIASILEAHQACTVRWIDAEAMTAQCSDIMLIETSALSSWNNLWEALRDSPMFATPHFKLESIVVGIEDDYVAYEAAES